MTRGIGFWQVALLGMAFAAPTHAVETVTYSYDALGRLVTSSVSGGPSAGVNTAIAYDPADNRTNYQVTGSTQLPPGTTFIVLPLNGYTVIPVTPSR